MLIGVETGGLRSDGSTPQSDWARAEKHGKVPPSGEGNGFATNYRDEFAGYAGAGLKAVRLNIEWAGLELTAGKFDMQRFEHERRVIDAAREAGLEVWLTLFQRQVPGWFFEEGGFADDKARGYFWPRYVDMCAENFGDAVNGWTPIDEQYSWASAGYLTGAHPPFRDEPRDFGAALRGTWLAWRDAWRLLRGSGAPVATAWNVAPTFVVDGSNVGRGVAARAEKLFWDVPVRAIRDGELHIPGRHPEEVPDLRDSCDIVGIACVGAVGYQQPSDRDAEPDTAEIVAYPSGARVDATLRAPWAEALGLSLHRVAEALPGRDVLVSSWGVATKHDDWRSALLRDVRVELAGAVKDGINIRAFFHRSGVDGYEGVRGYSGLTGVFDIDRNPKPSLADLTALE